MSTLAIVLIIVGVLVVVLFAGGLVVARRRLDRPGFGADVARADQALEAARAADRGWDRELLHETALQALSAERPGFEPRSLHLVLVDDRPGVEDDRAHLLATGPEGDARVVLSRDSAGEWTLDRVE
jgi:hypothetical protein